MQTGFPWTLGWERNLREWLRVILKTQVTIQHIKLETEMEARLEKVRINNPVPGLSEEVAESEQACVYDAHLIAHFPGTAKGEVICA